MLSLYNKVSLHHLCSLSTTKSHFITYAVSLQQSVTSSPMQSLYNKVSLHHLCCLSTTKCHFITYAVSLQQSVTSSPMLSLYNKVSLHHLCSLSTTKSHFITYVVSTIKSQFITDAVYIVVSHHHICGLSTTVSFHHLCSLYNKVLLITYAVSLQHSFTSEQQSITSSPMQSLYNKVSLHQLCNLSTTKCHFITNVVSLQQSRFIHNYIPILLFYNTDATLTAFVQRNKYCQLWITTGGAKSCHLVK